MNVSLPTIVLTGIRVTLGVFWLLQITWKPPPTFGCPNEGFCFWLDQEIQHPVIPLYADVVRAVVKPNAIAFGWLTTIVETAVGLSLLFGVFTRLGGLIGALWSANLLVGLANVPNEQGWYYAFLVLLNTLYFGVGGARQWAVDRLAGFTSWWGRPDAI
jgi:uncharacterized membrane protein YphA (DoxX/SURF4 family)